MKRPAGFITSLSARWLDAKRRELTAPLAFYSAKFDRVFIAPVGFVTDLASVPRLPFVFWLFGGDADEPATIHDYLYTGVVDRADADAVFAEACEVAGVAAWPRWAAVRLFGGSHYTPAVPGAAPDTRDTALDSAD